MCACALGFRVRLGLCGGGGDSGGGVCGGGARAREKREIERKRGRKYVCVVV